jgi:3-methyladenine DNA glycosylase AlkD
MNAREATELGQRIAALVETGNPEGAYGLLAPVLAERTPFRLLGRIGEPIGVGPLEAVNPFLEHIAAERTEGGWVVIGSGLGQQLGRDPAGAFTRSRTFIIAADVWYGADILGERVPGPALVSDFQPALTLLAPWREDANRWVRRTVGVAVHFWAKRSRGAAERAAQADALLALLTPLIEERDTSALKGIGWGLKTIGRYYPELLVAFLRQQLATKRPRKLLLRKATTYLDEARKEEILSL